MLLRRFRDSVAPLALITSAVVLEELRPKPQSLTWGCGDDYAVPAGVHIPMQATPGADHILWHAFAALLISLGAFLVIRGFALSLIESRRRVLRIQSHCPRVSVSQAIVLSFDTCAKEFLLGFSVQRRGPPVGI